jgi:hypothetical protein
MLRRPWARGSGVQSVFMVDISFMLVAAAGYSIAKRGSGVFAASNTQLHYLSNRETGACIDFLFCLSHIFSMSIAWVHVCTPLDEVRSDGLFTPEACLYLLPDHVLSIFLV